MKALRSESSSDVTTRTDVTSVTVHSNTPLHRRVQTPVFWTVVFMQSHILSSNAKCCHSARFNCSPFNRWSVRPAVAQSFFHQLNRHRTMYQLLVVVSSVNILIVRRPISSPCRQIRFLQGPQLQSDAQTTPLSRDVCTNAAPQKQRTKDRQRTAT